MPIPHQPGRAGGFVSVLLVLAALVVGGPGAVAAGGEGDGRLERAAAALGLETGDLEALGAGEIVARDLDEVADGVIAMSLAMVVPVPVDRLRPELGDDATFAAARNIMASGPLGDTPSDASGLHELTFEDGEAKELAALMQVAPGARFNLSIDEIRQIRKCARGAGAGAELHRAGLEVYRHLLLQRLRGYQTRGLRAVEPYARARSMSRPRDALMLAAGTEALVSTEMTEFYRALTNFPFDGPAGTEHRYLWMKEDVNDRPCVVLAHRLQWGDGEHYVATQREFYVGHGDNARQVTVGCLDLGDSTLVFYTNYQCTDRSGGGAGFKRRAARDRLRDQVATRLANVRATVTASAGEN